MTPTRRDGWTRLLEFDDLTPEVDAATDVELPEDLTVLSGEDLDTLLGELTDRFDEARGGDLSPDTVALCTSLRDAILKLRTEAARRETEAQEAADEVARLVDEVHPPEQPAEEAEEAVAEAVADAVEAEVEAEVVTPDEVIAPAPVPVAAAAAPRPSIGAVSRRAPAPSRRPGRERLPISITAAADVPGFANGARMDNLEAVAEGLHARARLLGNSPAKVPVARFSYPIPESDWVSQGEDPMPVLDRVRSPQAMTAAGGWCGPLEPLYNICRIDAADGMIDLPTIGVKRGGIQVPSPITIPADLSTVSWKWTNAMDMAALDNDGTGDVVKPCIRIPCPTWTPYELAAYGICVTHGNLADRSFPELTREYIAMVMNAHLHAMNAEKIAIIEAGSTAINGPEISDAASSVYGAADLAGEFYREKYHMANGAVLDIVLPMWVAVVIRATLAARAGVDLLNVPDSQVTAMFTARKLRPIFVQDWQPLANATAYPTALKMLIYPPGTWVVGSGGTLDLGVTRDSTLNAVNDFTAAWSEDFMLVAKVCTESLVVTSTLAVDGVTGCCP